MIPEMRLQCGIFGVHNQYFLSFLIFSVEFSVMVPDYIHEKVGKKFKEKSYYVQKRGKLVILAYKIDTFNLSFNLFIRLFLKFYLMTGIKKWVKLSFKFLKAIFIMLKMG